MSKPVWPRPRIDSTDVSGIRGLPAPGQNVQAGFRPAPGSAGQTGLGQNVSAYKELPQGGLSPSTQPACRPYTPPMGILSRSMFGQIVEAGVAPTGQISLTLVESRSRGPGQNVQVPIYDRATANARCCVGPTRARARSTRRQAALRLVGMPPPRVFLLASHFHEFSGQRDGNLRLAHRFRDKFTSPPRRSGGHPSFLTRISARSTQILEQPRAKRLQLREMSIRPAQGLGHADGKPENEAVGVVPRRSRAPSLKTVAQGRLWRNTHYMAADCGTSESG